MGTVGLDHKTLLTISDGTLDRSLLDMDTHLADVHLK